MKIARVFGFPSHGTKDRVSGVDFARVIQPMKQLDGFKLGDTKFETYVYDPVKDEKMDWRQVAKDFDIIYMNYTALPWQFATMGAMVRGQGGKIILDLDDDLWDIHSDNPAKTAYSKGSQPLKDFVSICNEVDAITTTSSFLKNIIANYTLKTHDRIKVLPNYINLDLYKHRSPFKNDGQIVLMHFGSTTHFIDLQSEEFEKGVDMIMKEYPNVILKTVGSLMPRYKWRWGQRYQDAYGHQDVIKWITTKFPGYMDECDILVTPLTVDTYNKAKSSIKFLEGSSAVKPGCWQDIRQYREVVDPSINGFLCATADNWHDSIKKLIDDVELRRKMGEEAFNTVSRSWQIQSHIKDYAEWLVQFT